MLQERMVIGDCYILQERAGEDSCTEHWIATAIFSATRFLLRFLKKEIADSETVDAIRRESLRSYNIRNAFVSDVIEMETFSDRVFLSYEYHGEITMERFLETGETSSLTQICKYAMSLAQGLQSFHDAGVVFGNLNAENVLFERKATSWTVKILKPSMIAALRILPASSQHDAFRYIAPEYSPVDSAGNSLSPVSDIYSIGIHAVRLVTGKLPGLPPADGVAPGRASLIFVTNALFRRGVPEALVRIILKTLLPNPAQRYQSCAEFARDMRAFLSIPEEVVEERTTVFEGSESVPPARHIPSFDSNEYFREMAGGKNRERKESAYPVRVLSGGDRDDQIESEELKVTAEESGWSIDDYIANGKRVVRGIEAEPCSMPADEAAAALMDDGLEAFSSRPVSPEPAAPSAKPERSPDPVPVQSPITSAKPETQNTSAQAPVVPQLQLPGIREEGFIQQITTVPVVRAGAKSTGKKRRRERPAGGKMSFSAGNERTWSYQRIQLQDVVGIVSKAAERAGDGFGSFRYIQEPESGYHNSELFESLESLSGKALYVNAGSCARYGTAETDDFIDMTRKALAEALKGESRNARTVIARAVAAKDEFRSFRQDPLGTVLFGKNASARHVSAETRHGRDASAAKALAAFGRTKKPLVLVVRGGERICRDLGDFFGILSREIARSPVAVVVFFESALVEDWHALSVLSSIR